MGPQSRGDRPDHDTRRRDERKRHIVSIPVERHWQSTDFFSPADLYEYSSRGWHVEAGAAAGTILPAMTLADALMTTRIHRVAGRTGDHIALVTRRSFQAPPHSILIGYATCLYNVRSQGCVACR